MEDNAMSRFTLLFGKALKRNSLAIALAVVTLFGVIIAYPQYEASDQNSNNALARSRASARSVSDDRTSPKSSKQSESPRIASVTSCVQPPSGIVGWWTADGNAMDIVGGNHGFLANGTAFAPGQVDFAFSLNQANQQYVGLPSQTVAALLNNSAGSIATWIDPASVAGFTLAAAFGNGEPGKVVGIGIDNGTVRIYHQTNEYDWQTGAAINAGSWTYVVYTWDASTERLYTNGTLAASRPRNFNYISAGEARIGFGFINDPSIFFTGLIDEVAIFDRALLDDEISSIYASGKGMCSFCTAMPAGSISSWNGDGIVTDVMGTNNGSWSGAPSYQEGKVGLAFSFDGSNFVVVEDSPSLRPSRFTVDAWVFPTDTAGNHNVVFKGDHEYVLQIRNGNVLFGSRDGSGTYAEIQGSLTVPSNKWSHIAVSHDGSTKRIYVNGVLDPVQQDQSGHSTINTGPLRIGAHNATIEYFVGLVDDVEIVSGALPQAEIERIYGAGRGGICSQTCSQPFTGLVGWWPGNASTADIVGGSTGTYINGPSYGEGKVGESFDLNGIDQYISVADHPMLRPSAFSIEAWVKVPSGGTSVIASKYDGAYHGWALYTYSGLIEFSLSRDSGANIGITAQGSPNIWNHVIATYDGVNARLYVDGRLSANKAFPGGYAASMTELTIGKASWFNGGYSAGKIDEVAFYERALSPTEIKSEHETGSLGRCSPQCVSPPTEIVGWWAGDGDVYDMVGGNNGTLMNGSGFGSGEIGRSFSFNGRNQYILINDPVPPILRLQNDITLSAWIYITGYPSTDPNTGLWQIVGSQYDTTTSGATIFVDGRADTDGQSNPPGHLHFQIGDGISWHATNSQTQIPLNRWVHIAATRRAGEDARIYYDGISQPVQSAPWPTGGISYSGARFAIGQQKDIDRAFVGRIDEPMIFGRSLSPTEIRAIYNAGNAGICLTQGDMSVSGRITTFDGRGIVGARLTLTDQFGNRRQTLSSPFGYFQFGGIASPGIYTVTVSSKRFVFNPDQQMVTVTRQTTDLDFVSSP